MSSDEYNDAVEVKMAVNAENFFMIIPEKGPPVSKMIVRWSSDGTAARENDSFKLSKSSSPSSVLANAMINGEESERPPVSGGEKANLYGNSRWRKLSGGNGSMADLYLVSHNSNG